MALHFCILRLYYTSPLGIVIDLTHVKNVLAHAPSVHQRVVGVAWRGVAWWEGKECQTLIVCVSALREESFLSFFVCGYPCGDAPVARPGCQGVEQVVGWCELGPLRCLGALLGRCHLWTFPSCRSARGLL